MLINIQQELYNRGYQAIKDPKAENPKDTNDIVICKLPLNYENPEIVAEVKWEEVKGKTTKENLDIILSKLPNETK